MEIKFIDYEDLRIFYKIDNLEVYPPSEDSFLLAKYIKIYSRGKVLDLGCGSGIQGLLALKNSDYTVFADIDKDAIKISKVNYVYNYIKKEDPIKILENLDNYKFKNVRFIYSDLFENINDKFDLVVFNPPYLPIEGREDNKLKRWVVGGEEGCEIIINFLDNVKYYIKNNGKVLFTFSSLSNEKKIFAKLQSFKYKLLEKRKFFFENLYVILLYF